MSQLTDEQVQECAKLHALFIARREDQNARNEKPISQEAIAHVLGVNHSRVSQITVSYTHLTLPTIYSV